MKTLRTKTGLWFECKVRYPKTMEDGMRKPVTEQYVVEAASFGDAEARMMEEATLWIEPNEEVKILAVKIAPYKEIVQDESGAAQKWFKATVDFITIDEKMMREKKTAYTFLLNAATAKHAANTISGVFEGSMQDYTQKNIVETKILDVYELPTKKDGQ